jgi:hypothetical protein
LLWVPDWAAVPDAATVAVSIEVESIRRLG